MTPFGRFKFNRVPFGINSAPEIFQQKMVMIFGDIPGVLVYFDDIGIVADGYGEHDRILATVLERARKHNVRFNPEKIQYRKTEMIFMGHIISAGTIRPGRKYSDAILNLKQPENRHDVMRLLGMIKYLGKYIPNLSQQTAELRKLTHTDVEFDWTEKHVSELENILKTINSKPVLTIYDPKQPVVVQTDASKDGLGCVLMQNEQPIAYASRTLSKSEKKWAQIEKELLAIVFACERFHYYLYGREFTVQSDHKPLETLVRRDIDDVSARLQRMFLFLLKYPKLEITCVPGKQMLVADCLSRAQVPDVCENKELAAVIHCVVDSVCITEDNFKLYQQLLKNDDNLMKVCKFVETKNWPGYHQLDAIGREFYKHKHEMHYERGLLFRDHRLVIPIELRKKICKWLHAPHLGIEKTLARARMNYYWPEMRKQLKEMIENCTVCETFKRNNTKEPLVQEKAPLYPFHVVSMDIFEYAGSNYIALIDAYSGFVMAERLNSKSSGHIIEVLRKIFNRIGYPTVIKSDNSPFSSLEFSKFAEDANVEMKFSSPRYAQSNGLAEKGVAIAKNILKRCYETQKVELFQYRLLEYNATPVASMKSTPAQLFFGRQVKTKMPVVDQTLCRNNWSEREIQSKLENKKNKQKYYYDRNAKSLPVLKVGDLIIF